MTGTDKDVCGGFSWKLYYEHEKRSKGIISAVEKDKIAKHMAVDNIKSDVFGYAFLCVKKLLSLTNKAKN